MFFKMRQFKKKNAPIYLNLFQLLTTINFNKKYIKNKISEEAYS